MDKIEVKIIKLKDTAVIPKYHTENAAAVDLCACLDTPIQIKSMERLMIPTGLSIEIPNGYEAQIRARSGLSIKNGIAVVNGVGTIDADYRGELCVLLINLSNEAFVIEPGMRIAQMIIAPYTHATFKETNKLSKTQRKGGFGSTGL